MIYILILALFFSFVFAINLFLNFRSKKHSNKFVVKIIQKLQLHRVLKIKKQGWLTTTFKTRKSLENISTKDILKNNWFSLNKVDCSGVADPFLFKKDDLYYLFFEYEYHKKLNKGADIGYATSINGTDWNFEHLVLKETFHQSFPYVFLQKEEVYMLPESYQSDEIRLYKAKNFPLDWKLDKVLYSGGKFVDTIFLEINTLFYWFTTNLKSGELLLFYSEGFKGEWIEHPKSPISKDLKNNRNAGAIIKETNNFYRPAQDGYGGYGAGINLYKIDKITKNDYKESAVSETFLYKQTGKFKDALHHISILNEDGIKLIAVDGANFSVKGIRI